MAGLIDFKLGGSTSKTNSFLKSMQNASLMSGLDAIAQQGVTALEAATPKESGLTAASWDYEIEQSGGSIKVTWTNSHNNGGANIAILLQYGHGTGTGGYVSGTDYINPAMKSVFDQITNEMWKKVVSS